MSPTATALAELGIVAAGGGAMWLVTRARNRADAALYRLTPRPASAAALPVPVTGTRGLEAAELIGWEQLLRAGALAPVAPVITDPGNPGRWLALVEDPTGALGLGGVRVLIAVNGSPEKHDGSHSVVGIPVPAGIGNPLEAAAWAHDDPTHPLRTTATAYAAMAARS